MKDSLTKSTFLAGLAWGGNSALFYLTYYEDFDAATFLSWVPVVGGASGVFFGGVASDWIKQRLGLRAHLWLLGAMLVMTLAHCQMTLPKYGVLTYSLFQVPSHSWCYIFLLQNHATYLWSIIYLVSRDSRTHTNRLGLKISLPPTAETWLSILTTIIVELVPAAVKGRSIACRPQNLVLSELFPLIYKLL